MLAGYASETELIPCFHKPVAAFKEIEERGCCEVDDMQCEVPIKNSCCCRRVFPLEIHRTGQCMMRGREFLLAL
jgi:hypothetical protein